MRTRRPTDITLIPDDIDVFNIFARRGQGACFSAFLPVRFTSRFLASRRSGYKTVCLATA
jgi:hypothetical protein